MIAFRDRRMKELGLPLIVHVNRDGLARGIGPLSHGAAVHTDIMKTEALKQALDLHGFDAAIGGARRDEEPSRAKERIFSLRSAGHRWDPRGQRPELWRLYNGRLDPGESIRVFPLSNWTELDIWTYIERENIPVVPLYFAAAAHGGRARRHADPASTTSGSRCGPSEMPQLRWVRFRTLGCYPLTGAIEFARRHRPRHHRRARSLAAPRSARAAPSTTATARWSARRSKATSDGRACPRGADLLRFITCGSVDDGKSTLIGRLLVDADVVPDDQLAARDAALRPRRVLDLACWSTACRRSASRASPSTSAIATSRRRGGASSSPTRRATSSTRATWRRARRPPTSPSSWSTRPRACCRRPAGTAPSWR